MDGPNFSKCLSLAQFLTCRLQVTGSCRRFSMQPEPIPIYYIGKYENEKKATFKTRANIALKE